MPKVIPITRIVCKGRDLTDTLERDLRRSVFMLSPEGEAWRREVHAEIETLLDRGIYDHGRDMRGDYEQQEDK